MTTNDQVIVATRIRKSADVELDPRGWALWLLAGALITMSTRNPLYLILLLVISRTVDAVCGGRYAGGLSLPFWRLAAIILTFSVIFNMLMAHVGATVLFILPENWWLVGGPITLEAAVFGLTSGLSLITLLSFFLAFSRVVPPHQLIQLAPRALHELGLVTLIAITYIPQTIEQQKRIREARAIRGFQPRGLRSWRPLIIPLLVSGLERSLSLAETMVSRGFGAVEVREQPAGARLLLLVALVLALGGALWLAWGGVEGWLLLAVGLAVLGVAYWTIGRHTRHTRYKPHRWHWQDTLMVAAAAVPLVLLVLPAGIVDRAALAYAPYSGALVPQFDPFIGLIMLVLAMPAVLELI